jgi:hypothetical protein
MLAAQWKPDQIFQMAAIPPVIVAGLLLVMASTARVGKRVSAPAH